MNHILDNLKAYFTVLPQDEVENILGEIHCKAIRATARTVAAKFIEEMANQPESMNAQELHEKVTMELSSCLAASMFKGANIMAVTLRERGREACE